MASPAVTPPAILPADFNGWDKTPPKVLPADFAGWDKPSTPAMPAGVPAGVTLGQPSAHPAVTMHEAPREPGNLETIPASRSEPGFVGALQTGVHNFGARVANNGLALLKPVLHPQQTGSEILQRGGFPITPDAIKASSYNPSGPDAGATTANVLGDVATAGLLHALPGEAVNGIKKVPNVVRSAIAGDVNKPITGSNTTPLQRFNSAQNLGVNLDAADATNSGPLKVIKKLNENSLLGGNSYEKLGAANTGALQGSTDTFLNKMYEGDRESGGAAIQKALKGNQEGLYSSAQKGFDSLPQDVEIPGLSDVGKTAQGIVKENAAYQNLFPSLKPGKAMNVVGDVSKLAPSPTEPASPQNFSTGQKLRSDLLDFTRNNPDIVQNQGNGFIQRLAGETDNALTNASSSLKPEQLETFRNANANWKDMKATYDDPSSPLYHAVRTNNPSSLYGGVGSKTPENARNLATRLGPAIDPLRRGTVEGALKPTSEGLPNFKTFGTQLNRIPADYRAELFSPDQNVTLRDIASTSNVLNKDFNPSGSAKLGQKIAEGAAMLHPTTMAGPLLQFPIAKLMTSPKAVQWLMRQPIRSTPFSMPTAATSALSAAALTPKKR